MKKNINRAGFRKIDKTSTTTSTTITTNDNSSSILTEQRDNNEEKQDLNKNNKIQSTKKSSSSSSTSSSTTNNNNNTTNNSISPSTKKRSRTSSTDKQNQNDLPKKKNKQIVIGEEDPISQPESQGDDEKVKTYYPKITYDPMNVIKILQENYPPTSNSSNQSTTKNSKRRNSSSSSSSSISTSLQNNTDISNFSHELICTTLVNQVCQQELNGLKTHFADERFKSKDSVAIHLYNILENLTSIVADNLPSDVQFAPEFSPRETQQIEELNNVLAKLQSKYDILREYRQNENNLYKEMDLLTKNDVNEVISQNSSPSTSVILSNEIESYHKKLESLTTTINGLLEGLDSVAKEANIAKDSQEKLYTAHHRERFSHPNNFTVSSPSSSPSNPTTSSSSSLTTTTTRSTRSNTTIPKDTKSLIKEFPK